MFTELIEVTTTILFVHALNTSCFELARLTYDVIILLRKHVVGDQIINDKSEFIPNILAQSRYRHPFQASRIVVGFKSENRNYDIQKFKIMSIAK